MKQSILLNLQSQRILFLVLVLVASNALETASSTAAAAVAPPNSGVKCGLRGSSARVVQNPLKPGQLGVVNGAEAGGNELPWLAMVRVLKSAVLFDDDDDEGGEEQNISAANATNEPTTTTYVWYGMATLISARWALTSAHTTLVYDPARKRYKLRPDEMQVVFNIRNLTSMDPNHQPQSKELEEEQGALVRNVSRIVYHPWKPYHRTPLGNIIHDIALLELDSDLPLGLDGAKIAPICLPESETTQADDSLVGHRCTVASWGEVTSVVPLNLTTEWAENPFVPENRLRNITIGIRAQSPLTPKVSDEQWVWRGAFCRQAYERFSNGVNHEIGSVEDILPSNGSVLCANGGGSEQAACWGDSGAALICPIGKEAGTWTQVGVVSFNPDACGHPLVPTLYTRVSHYLDWIRSVTGI